MSRAPELFCPRCAAPMERAGGELRCGPGDMPLSATMEAELLRRFAERVNPERSPPDAGASWYCPACRVPMDQEMKCAECAGTLRGLHFQLVEMHPHRNPA
jgi:hypothetical protein